MAGAGLSFDRVLFLWYNVGKGGAMPREGYYQIRLTDEMERHIRAVCRQLGLDANDRGAYAKAIYFALRLVATRLVEQENDY